MSRPHPYCRECCFYGEPKQGERQGSCRRSAPSPGSGWAAVDADDWCADWQGTDGEGWVTWQVRKMREAMG